MKFLICIFFFIAFQSKSQEIFKLTTSLDTVINAYDFSVYEGCKNQSMKAFINDSIFRDVEIHYFSGTDDNVISQNLIIKFDDSVKQERFDSISKIQNKKTIKAQKINEESSKIEFHSTVNFLFSWQDSLIVSIAYDTTEQIKNEQQSYLPINSKLFEQLDKENSVYQYKGTTNFNDLFHITKLKQDIPDSSKLSYQDVKNKEGVYWLINSNPVDKKEENKIIFLAVDEKGNAGFIRPVQFWVYMPIYDALIFSKNNNLEFIDKTVKHFVESGRILNYPSLIFQVNNMFKLVAIGYGDNEVTQKPKWKKLIDFNVFGNYKCMYKTYSIPALPYFNINLESPDTSMITSNSYIPFDSVATPIYDRTKVVGQKFIDVKAGYKMNLHGITPMIVELKKKFQCTGIYGINQYEFAYGKFKRLGTVNNIEYLPGVYFLPDYFKINSINGLSLEEFAKTQCKN